MKQKIEEDENTRREQKIRPRSRKFIFLWSLFLLFVIGSIFASFINDQAGSKISLLTSVKGLL